MCIKNIARKKKREEMPPLELCWSEGGEKRKKMGFPALGQRKGDGVEMKGDFNRGEGRQG